MQETRGERTVSEIDLKFGRQEVKTSDDTLLAKCWPKTCAIECISAKYFFISLTSTGGFEDYHFFNLVPVCLKRLQTYHFDGTTWGAIARKFHWKFLPLL